MITCPSRVKKANHERLLVLFEIIAAIQDHSDLPEILEEYDGVKWLPMSNIVNGHIEADPQLTELLDRLSEFLGAELITNDGHHSDLFYDLREYGYMTRTGESDSYGPLSSVLSPPGRPWRVSYG